MKKSVKNSSVQALWKIKGGHFALFHMCLNSQFWEGQNWSVCFCTQTSIVPCTPDAVVTVFATQADLLSLWSISCADIYRILWLYALGKGMFMWSRKSEGQIHYKWIVVLSSCAFTLTVCQTEAGLAIHITEPITRAENVTTLKGLVQRKFSVLFII